MRCAPDNHYSIVLPSWPNPRSYRSLFDKETEADIRELPFNAVSSWDSPKSLRTIVYILAQYFRREFNYDFVQYGVDSTDDHIRDRAFLWRSHPMWYPEKAIGAASFRWWEYNNIPHCYTLQWVWFHPYERCQGHLSKAWPYFRERFGDFIVDTPLSPAMEVFLNKHGWPNPMQREKYEENRRKYAEASAQRLDRSNDREDALHNS